MGELFDKSNVVTRPYWKPEKVGDFIKGVYVDKETIPNNMKEGATQVRYTIINDDDGEQWSVYGRHGEPAVLSGLEVRKFGDHVGIRYDEEKPPTQKGYSPTKVINVYYAGEKKDDVLRDYQNPVATTLPGVEEADGDDPFVE